MEKLIGLVVILFVLALGAVTSCTSVSTGHVGVVKHFGAVDTYALGEGVHFTSPWPFTDVEEVTVQTSATETESAASSKDLQAVHTKVTVQWSIDPVSAPRLVQRFGTCDGCWTNGIINPAVQEVVKAVSARYTAEQLVTERAQVKREIEVGLNEFIGKTMSERGAKGAIKIANVAVTNFDFSKEFNESIEAKVKAEQDSLRAENEKRTRITQAEAKAREVTLAAEADAKQVTLKADASAYSIDANSKAKAAAIKRESDALAGNPALVELRRIEQWDGKLPTFTGGGVVPMMQVAH